MIKRLFHNISSALSFLRKQESIWTPAFAGVTTGSCETCSKLFYGIKMRIRLSPVIASPPTPQGGTFVGRRGNLIKGGLQLRTGFSLLEILVALMILVMGVTSILGLFGSATYSNRRGINDAIVGRMAAAIIADLQSGVHPAASDLRPRRDQSYAGFPGLYKYDLTFDPVPNITEPKSRVVTITIKWARSGESFRTLLFFPNSP